MYPKKFVQTKVRKCASRRMSPICALCWYQHVGQSLPQRTAWAGGVTSDARTSTQPAPSQCTCDGAPNRQMPAGMGPLKPFEMRRLSDAAMLRRWVLHATSANAVPERPRHWTNHSIQQLVWLTQRTIHGTCTDGIQAEPKTRQSLADVVAT